QATLRSSRLQPLPPQTRFSLPTKQQTGSRLSQGRQGHPGNRRPAGRCLTFLTSSNVEVFLFTIFDTRIYELKPFQSVILRFAPTSEILSARVGRHVQLFLHVLDHALKSLGLLRAPRQNRS